MTRQHRVTKVISQRTDKNRKEYYVIEGSSAAINYFAVHICYSNYSMFVNQHEMPHELVSLSSIVMILQLNSVESHA